MHSHVLFRIRIQSSNQDQNNEEYTRDKFYISRLTNIKFG